MTKTLQEFTLKDTLAYGLFWSWNLIFLAFMVLGFAPNLLPELLVNVSAGTIPTHYLIYALILSVIPLVAVILGLTRLRRAPSRLFALGYVVEGPLMLLLAIRFFLIRQATPGFTLMMTIALLGMAAFLWYVLDPEIERRGRLGGYLRLVGLTFMLLTSLYAALWIAFYALPLAAAAVNWIGHTLLGFPDFVRRLGMNITDMISRPRPRVAFGRRVALGRQGSGTVPPRLGGRAGGFARGRGRHHDHRVAGLAR